jgi:hypothetical protein
MSNTFLDIIKKPIYMVSMSTIYISYFLIYFGILSSNHEYIAFLDIFIQLFICFFLILRFNPFIHRHVLRDFDGQIIFACAIFLLTNLFATEIGLTYYDYFYKLFISWFDKT